MPEIIFDCCCISNFALSDSLFVLEHLYGKSAYITNFVLAEILRGIQQRHTALGKILKAMKDGWLKEANVSSKQEKFLFEPLSVSLGLGEASSISVAKSRKFIFASDDRTARKEAGFLDIKLTGTNCILKKALIHKTIDLKEGNRILSKMIKNGFYSPVKSLKKI
jgi:predicted nucleic acid-binding protein